MNSVLVSQRLKYIWEMRLCSLNFYNDLTGQVLLYSFSAGTVEKTQTQREVIRQLEKSGFELNYDVVPQGIPGKIK